MSTRCLKLTLTDHFARMAQKNPRDKRLAPLLNVLESRSAVLRSTYKEIQRHIDEIIPLHPALGDLLRVALKGLAPGCKRDFMVVVHGDMSLDFGIEEFGYEYFTKKLEALKGGGIVEDVEVTLAPSVINWKMEKRFITQESETIFDFIRN